MVALVPLSQVTKQTGAGAKAHHLSVLLKMGYRVPHTFVLPYSAFEAYLRDRDSGLKQVERLLAGRLDAGTAYSVRSSASVEDSSRFSFAGQFETHLNVVGSAAVTAAVEHTWRSAGGAQAHAYTAGLGYHGPAPKMAVIIQEMVVPEFSGVVFTQNPITGLDEVVVETVDGYGDALVQGGVTPDRWVYKWGTWLETPHVHEERTAIILHIIQTSQAMAQRMGLPLDLEWAYDGHDVIWLQMRAITTLRNTQIYSNRISREFLPGMIVPLVWSVNIPVVNSSWKRLFMELIGGSAAHLDVHKLAKSFYYRAYFNMGVIGDMFALLGMPREILEILAGIEVPDEGRPSFRPSLRSLRYLPRLIAVSLRKLFFAKDIELFLRRMTKAYQELAGLDVAAMDEGATLRIIESLFTLNTEAAYFVIVSQLLNSIYHHVLRRQLERRGLIFEHLPFTDTSEQLQSIDPRQQLNALHQMYLALDIDKRNLLTNVSWQTALHRDDLGAFRDRLHAFIRRFGHLSESGNDFSKPTWREDPTLILQMVIGHRTAAPENEAREAQAKLDAVLTGSPLLRLVYARAAKYQEYRERVNFLYTFGYGLFRRFFKRLECVFRQRGLLEHADDIFYLTYHEVTRLLKDPSTAASLRRKITEHKEAIERYRDVSLPVVIFNELPPSALLKGRVLRNLRGVATSRGHAIGPARVVHGPRDFPKIQAGDVLVIPYSDVSWTPLFSKAAAVVSASGGILSHCSIVAREYGIPAVVSVHGAMALVDGTPLAVDGYRGEVEIREA